MIAEALEGFGKVEVCGWPWHGLIKRAGSFDPYRLYLPNGTTRAHPLPERPWCTYRVKVPGVAPVVRDPAQIAADLAAGRGWRDDAVVSGSRFQLYDRELGGWVYCAPDQSRWLISVNLNEKTATATRFGMVGLPSDVRTATVTWPADEGQATPALGGLIYKIDRAPVDLLPDGSKAVFMFYTDDPAGQPDVRLVPLGFLMCQVSGSLTAGFALTFTVLRTRQQTLGVASYEDDTVIVRNAFGQIISASGTATRLLEGRVWAMWFTPEGMIEPCTIDVTAEFEQQCPEDLSSYYSRNRVLREVKFGTYTTAVDFESVFDGVTAADPDYWAQTATGSLNGEQFFSSETLVEKVPAGVEPPVPLTDAQRMLQRGTLSQVFTADFHDHHLIGNNAIGFYIVITPPGDTPVHRYLGAMTPAGVVALDSSITATPVSGGTHYALYGPAPFGAFNPSTGVLASPEEFPVGWV